MAYTKTEWVNGTSPNINANNLNKIEQGIYDNDTHIGNLDNLSTTAKSNLVAAVNEVASSSGGGAPIGVGMDYFGTTAPEDWMFADGSAISRTEYAELFAIIGTTYGVGDGSTTFNLPDKRERVSVMYKENSTMGTTGATFGTMGAKGGEDMHTLDTTEIPSHNHKVTTKEGYGTGSTYYVAGIHQETTTATKEINTSSTGGGNAHNNLQPYLVCNYIIKVK